MGRLLVLATAGALLFAGTALADDAHVSGKSSDALVTLSGTVERIENDQQFTLRDNHGSFDVTMLPGNAAVLNEGDSVSVTGSLGQRAIEAYTVKVHQRADL